MTHLSPAQAVEVAEGSAAPALIAHAASCGPCRAKVESLLEAVRLAAVLLVGVIPLPILLNSQ